MECHRKSGYFGTHDTVLSQYDPGSNFGGDATLYADGDDPPGLGNDRSTLLSWDTRAIPAGSTVTEVSITLNVFNASNETYQLYEVKRNWVEGQSTWNLYSTTQVWEIPGALGPEDRSDAVLGSYSPGKTGNHVINLNREGVALVQMWVDNPIDNHGLIFANGSVADGFDFASREALAVAGRPKLTVRYSEDHLPKIEAIPWITLLLLD